MLTRLLAAAADLSADDIPRSSFLFSFSRERERDRLRARCFGGLLLRDRGLAPAADICNDLNQTNECPLSQ